MVKDTRKKSSTLRIMQKVWKMLREDGSLSPK